MRKGSEASTTLEMRGRESIRRAASTRPASERLTVLAIADSPLVRQLLASTLSKEADFSVTTAFDWAHAEKRLRSSRPDVVVLCSDRLWPDDEGARVVHEQRIPLVAGALDVRAKTLAAALLDLVARIRKAPPLRPPGPSPASSPSIVPWTLDVPTTPKIVALGASAGGTMALKEILPALPARSPAMVIVQHMSEHFTGTFANGLGRMCSIEVVEAEDGDPIVEGRALIAPGNRHTVIERRGSAYFIGLREGPLLSRHRPSVNVLFRSVAQEAGPNGVGVILTGMGDDGADGLFEMKELGASTLAQNEATSVVFGMPRAAILRGGVEEVVPLPQLPAAILKLAGYMRRPPRA